MEPPKPARQSCQYCTNGGCSIYEARPDACVGFKCLWLASQEIPGHGLSSLMRPDRSGVVMDLNEAGTIIAHCRLPGSWKREPMLAWLLRYAARTNVILDTPLGSELLKPNAQTDPLERVGIDPISNLRLYVRRSDLAKFQDGAVS
ncbi:hypothetical protein [Sphingomonas sp. TREG-RG-20F-R18-01]|uniref:hypothetical protein n=1 Tax=Sphingomonas sp. TREG-RG-20F-R18-01 TaxID=2914982 RepID=UPI001F5883FE|nr:hypothetical protein [Sphingomonas sp. TREG-RG-20F-R18-01]